MKNAFAILILIIFFFSQVANYLVYTVLRYCEEKKMEAKLFSTLPESECQIINFTSHQNNIYWEKEDEFILNGIEYDVAKKKTINGNLYLYCITEEKEVELMNDLTPKISSAGDGGVDFELSISEDYVLPCNEDAKLPESYTSNIFSSLSIPFTQRCKDIILPPPRIAGTIA